MLHGPGEFLKHRLQGMQDDPVIITICLLDYFLTSFQESKVFVFCSQTEPLIRIGFKFRACNRAGKFFGFNEFT